MFSRWRHAVAAVAAALVFASFAADRVTAQVGNRVACNPSVSQNNVICGRGRRCELLSGDCGLFGFLCFSNRWWPRIDLGQCHDCENAVGGCDPVPCNDDMDCLDGVEFCAGGNCWRAAGRCASADDCAGNQNCVANACVIPADGPTPAPRPGPGCVTSADCLGGWVCHPLGNGHCVPTCEISGGIITRQCPSGYACVQGVCHLY
jgi:hypothetical protein